MVQGPFALTAYIFQMKILPVNPLFPRSLREYFPRNIRKFPVLTISLLYKSRWGWGGLHNFLQLHIGQFYNHETFLTFLYDHSFPASLK